MQHSIEFKPSVVKSLKKIPKKDLIKIKSKIENLAEYLPNQNFTKLKGNNPFHRIRSGNYRIIYTVDNNKLVILVVKIGHRKDIYKSIG